MFVSNHRVRIKQNFSASVETLFQSCLKGTLFSVYSGDRYKAGSALKVGDTFHCELKGGQDFMRVEVKKIHPVSAMTFTWSTMAGDEATGVTTVTLYFSTGTTGSTLELIQENIASASAAESQDESWDFVLKEFSGRLDGARP